jgi:hypothetical protein
LLEWASPGGASASRLLRYDVENFYVNLTST